MGNRAYLAIIVKGIIFFGLIWIYENINFLYIVNQYKRLSGNNTKCLIVADPQLIGQEFNNKILNHLSKWDSDRYLHLSYWYASEIYKPGCIIFLGDLFDQGSLIDNDTYSKHVFRFNSIYKYKDKLHFFVDGDNDVTEKHYLPLNQSFARFNNYFTSSQTFLSNSLLKISLMKMNNYQFILDETLQTQPNIHYDATNCINFSKNVFNILLSHMTISDQHPTFKCKVFYKYAPNLILSGDIHKSRLYYTRYNHLTGALEGTFSQLFEETSIYKLNSTINLNITLNSTVNFHNDLQPHIYEISVPSANYRMGTERTGLGLLEIQTNPGEPIATLIYHVIWLPYRFRQLSAYVLILILYILFYAFKSLAIRILWPNKNQIRSASPPLTQLRINTNYLNRTNSNNNISPRRNLYRILFRS